MPITLPLSSGGDYAISPSKIVCLGLNYDEHIAESRSAIKLRGNRPTEPVLFAKTPNVLIGPDQAIQLPRYVNEYGFRNPRTDHEAELALIIKDRIHAIDESEAMAHVLGFTCFNDVSQRNFQKHDPSGWFRGKSLDTFGPIGPQIVTASDLGDPQALDIVCRVNGQTRQASNTAKMIFQLPQLIAFISRHFTLEAGDLIVTGTPSGVGPLVPNDVVEVEIEGIGTLRNPVEEI